MHSSDPISQPEFPQPASQPEIPPSSVQPEFQPPALAQAAALPERRQQAAVDLLDVLCVVMVGFVALFFATLIAFGIYWFAHRSQNLTPESLSKAFSRDALYLVFLQLAAYGVVVAFMAVLVWGRHKVTLPKAISWNAPSSRHAGYAVAGGVALALFSDIGDIALSPWIPKSLPITELFRDRQSAFLLAGFGILVAPLVEELVFRGFLYPALARLTGAMPAILVTAAGFTALHGAQLGYSWAPLLLIFIVGITLTAVRAVTGSVALCVLVHMTYNFVLLAQTFFATHGFRQMQGV